MKSKYSNILFFGFILVGLFMISCEDRNDDDVDGSLDDGEQTEFIELLSNQVSSVIIPTMNNYASAMEVLSTSCATFRNESTQTNLGVLIDAYRNAYLKYQAAAVHNYYATANQGLVMSTNLYPLDTEMLNGFINFLTSLIASMFDRATILAEQWNGDLRENFINNGGTGLGSSISVQLNDHLLYFEEHIRENKVGIPIGRLGPNDDLITPDGKKIEAYYQSVAAGNDAFSLSLLRAAIEEVEDLYLGSSDADPNGQGYDDLVNEFSDPTIDQDIKKQFNLIYETIDGRSSISGDDTLYNAIQEIVTLYKSELLPVLNVQDADGANDGD